MANCTCKITSTSTVVVNNGKAYQDAFERPDMRLYIPVDREGKLTELSRAISLQCWITGERNPQIPEAMTMSAEGITASLIRNQHGDEFGTLSRSVAYGSIAKMELWLRTLHRHEKGDITNFTVGYR